MAVGVRNPQERRSKSRPRRKFSALENAAIWFFVVLQAGVLGCFQLIRPDGNTASVDRVTESLVTLQREPDEDRELKDAMGYVKSFERFDRQLSFFHIPKTAGTAVEQVAAENGIAWGSCLFKHSPKRKICPHPEGEEWPKNVGWWHIPSQFFPLLNSNPYSGAELFGIVRDPFDRLVSEFYYLCTLKVKEWRPSQCDRNRIKFPAYMNEWLSHKLQYKQGNLALKYLMDNSHFTTHYEYVVGPHDVRMLDYVLVLDKNRSVFQRDFARLMKAFHLPIELRTMQSISSHHEQHGDKSNSSNTLLSTQHLTNQSTFWIRRKYVDDFEKLGFASG